MKKNRMFDTKGFMLVETLMVSLTISGILIYMYAQFSTINNSYQRLYQYNTADSVYRVGALKEFLLTYNKGTESIYSSLSARKITCTNIISSSGANRNYCNKIVEEAEIGTIILTVDNFNKSTVLNLFSSTSDDYVKLDKYLNAISKGTSDKYRLIVLFNDGTIATALFKF